jgi:hypothetical protein
MSVVDRATRTMTLPKDFWEQLPLKTDAELCDMFMHPADYLPEALAAAKDEFSKRNLAPERVSRLETEVQSQMVAADAKAQERLGWPMRIFLFIFCAGLLGLLLAVYYEGKGYKGKARDCWITLAASVVFYSALGVLSQIFR